MQRSLSCWPTPIYLTDHEVMYKTKSTAISKNCDGVAYDYLSLTKAQIVQYTCVTGDCVLPLPVPGTPQVVQLHLTE